MSIALGALGFISAFTGIFTGFLLVLLSKKMGRRVEAALTGFTAGLLLSFICFKILEEGFSRAPLYLGTLGLLSGAVFAAFLEGFSAKLCYGALAVTLHHFSEGVALGGLGGVSLSSGAALAIVVCVHCIPEAAAVFVPIKEIKPRHGLLCVPLALPMAIGSVFGAFFSKSGGILLPLSLTFSGGLMLYLTCGEMLPESRRVWNGRLTTLSALAGFILGVVITNQMMYT